jgi:transcriptional regulator with XRE-family HTH domain
MNPIRFIRTRIFRLNQAEFGRMAGLSQPAVSRIENGEQSPSLEDVARIRAEAKRQALSWDDAWLFGSIPNEASQAVRRRANA